MNERVRYRIAAAASFGVHALAVAAASVSFGRPQGFSQPLIPPPKPLVVEFAPDEAPRRLVDASVPATQAPSAETDLIATQNSLASDMSEDDDGERIGPAAAVESEFDDPGGTPAAETAPTLDTAMSASSDERAAREEVETAASEERELEDSLGEPVEVAKLEAIRPPAPPSPPATAAPPSPAPREFEAPRQPRGRGNASTARTGFLNFEAMQHELAPYMAQVRQRVEKRWRIALELRYTGSQPAQAVVDCAISPQGELVYVRIVDPGPRVGFSTLCKEALEKAAPFGPFPFETPDMYREKNLEIRWTFNFL